jgi:IS5 family transposase
VFRLPLRQAEGFLRSPLIIMGLSLAAPDHTTLSRRSRGLDVDLKLVSSKKPIYLIVDSTGLSNVGEGEWAFAKHGKQGTRGLRKLHIGVDKRGNILAQVMTQSTGDDANTGLLIIKATKGKLSSVTGDAAYDTRQIYARAASGVALVIVPPVKSASATCRGPRSAERDRTIRRINKVGWRRWKKEPGYHRQETVEKAFFRYKTMLGDRLHARGLATQRTEVALGCKVLNRMLDRGRPKSVAFARGILRWWGT